MADSDLFHSRYSHLVTLFFLCQLATNHKIKQLSKVDPVLILLDAIYVSIFQVIGPHSLIFTGAVRNELQTSVKTT